MKLLYIFYFALDEDNTTKLVGIATMENILYVLFWLVRMSRIYLAK
jgi:hypothetical protein